MADWPSSAKRGGNFYYKVATNADEILVGDTEDDIDASKRKQIQQNHAHYYKENGNWYVRNTVGGTHQEIVARYGREKYGESLYGTSGASVDEGVSSWLDSL